MRGHLLLLALALAMSMLSSATQARTTTPNIIIILADDLGVGDLSINGSVIRTPNIDRLAQEGASLRSFYASANVCTPSRAGLLTGRYPIRTGLATNVIEAESSHGLPADEITLAEMLAAHHYHSALIGKWHLGHTPASWPTRQGFDYFYGLLYSNDMQPLVLYRNEDAIEKQVDQNSLTQNYTQEAIKFIRRNKATPFFLYFSHTFPHIPLHASDTFRGKSAAGIYGDAVEELDWSVGAVMATLKELKLDENTLVFFSSDNGAWFEGSNGNFRDMKGLSWEGAYRVPLFARWPGQIAAGTVSDGIAMNIDILPTIKALLPQTPAKANELDGRDIWSLLQGGEQSPHETLYLFHNEDIAALRTQKWKYLSRAYYRTNYIGFEGIKAKMGFDYALLFDMEAAQPERYSQAENEVAVLQDMRARLQTGQSRFEKLRTAPAARVYP